MDARWGPIRREMDIRVDERRRSLFSSLALALVFPSESCPVVESWVEYPIFSRILSAATANSCVAWYAAIICGRAFAPWYELTAVRRSEKLGCNDDIVEVMSVDRVGCGSGKMAEMDVRSVDSIVRNAA